MDKRLKASLAAAVLLAGAGAFLLYWEGNPSRQRDVLRLAQRNALDDCLRAAQMIFDVHWAAACATQGDGNDHAECDLPDAKAAVVNAWLNQAEARCLAEARGGPDPAVTP